VFDIGFSELLLLAVISLLVLGPERLPGAVRTAGVWISRIRHSFNEVRSELERELNATELKQDLHNQSILKQLEDTGRELNQDLDAVRAGLKDLQFDLDSSPESESTPTKDPGKTIDHNS
jgi:sec-independent protein translocase protein TatB